MRTDTPLAVIWRRRWIVAATLLVFVASAALVSKSLEKVYGTEATLLVVLPAGSTTYDAVQGSQTVARSYADIMGSPNIARLVASRLGNGTRTEDLLGVVSLDPIVETQLLKVRAEDPDPARAKLIADTYAQVFVAYARRELAETTRATVSLADAAPLPRAPARPKPTLYVLVAMMFGLALGLALAFLRDRLDHRLRTFEEVEAEFDAPVLARVPRRGRSEQSVVAFKEAYRILRTNLQFASAGGRLQSIAVVSSAAGEGKTTTVTQLALTSAEVGEQLVVVEADLRRPSLQDELMMNREKPLRPGLSNYLAEATSLEQVIYPTGRPNISIVPSGPLPPSPAALLESRRGRTAVHHFLSQADLVIVDCPPLSIGADASVISGWVDGVIVVVDLQSATDHGLRDALRQLEAVQAPLLGLVINRDRAAESKSYEYYMPETKKAERSRRARSRVA